MRTRNATGVAPRPSLEALVLRWVPPFQQNTATSDAKPPQGGHGRKTQSGGVPNMSILVVATARMEACCADLPTPNVSEGNRSLINLWPTSFAAARRVLPKKRKHALFASYCDRYP